MKQRHPFENRYCCGCRITTRHEVKGSTFSCLRCGAVKTPIQDLRRAAVVLGVSQNAVAVA